MALPPTNAHNKGFPFTRAEDLPCPTNKPGPNTNICSPPFKPPLDITVIVAALATIPLTIVQESGVDGLWVTALDWTVWAVFLVEFVFMVWVVRNRWAYARRAWLSIAVIVLSFPMLPDLLALARLARLTRLARLARLVRLVAVTGRGLHAVKNCLGRESLVYVAGLTILLTVAGGVFLTALEPDTVKQSLMGGIWWAVVTVTTVGYGDIAPATAGGRLVAVVLMLSRLGLLSTLSASISAYFVNVDREDDLEHLRDQLDRIERLLEQQKPRQGGESGQG